jgi:hypothetical protein
MPVAADHLAAAEHRVEDGLLGSAIALARRRRSTLGPRRRPGALGRPARPEQDEGADEDGS